MKTLTLGRAIPLLLTLSLAAMLALPSVGMAAEPTVPLGAAQNFAVLAGQTITNTGNSVISGDVGVSPGSAITGFGTVTLSGTMHSNDALAIQAQTDWTTAYNNAVGRPVTTNLASPELSGLTLTPGVYSSGGALALTGTLTLDAQGDPEAVFILKSDSGLTIGAGSEVRLINGARFCRVFWPVASSATLGANATFVGHILAVTSISLDDSASVEGQLLAHDGEVTLINNVVRNDWCATSRAIGITKTASVNSLASAGPVTYTYIVTNPGTVVLSNVVVTDDKISPVTYVSGDTNGDALLQPGETWTYTATANIAATTTNIGNVTANSTGTPVEAVTATDSYTVIVGSVPPRTVSGGQLPRTSTPWYNVLVASIALALLGAIGLTRANSKIDD